MASTTVSEKGNVAGLTVLTSSSANKNLSSKPSQDTLASGNLSPSAEKVDGRPRTSDVSTPSTAHLNPFDTDIEAIITTTETHNRKSMECTKGGTDCHVWPTQDHWKAKAKKAKAQRRNCNCFDHLSKRNRLIVKIVLAMLVVGIAVGVGIGVSKAVGASIWQNPRN